MTKAMRISLKAGEKIYLNGAVFCADRKVTLELLNDAVFLLEGHVMQVENTTTPLRQLYFIVQSVLMYPSSADEARRLASGHLTAVMRAYSNQEMLVQLEQVKSALAEDRCFDALRQLRQLFPLEDSIIEGNALQQCEVA
ncbi:MULTISPECIES: flagellar biosynthesis repressor FlbT [Xanthobacter]|uniref:flagellar biosynthesis repressor FlbT n=1 Tax=Xanthobacter TaxID=279 RepID=UPI001F2E0360|nr:MULTISPECIES: flagellar biosynthesis repressor FlbT [unclassified Xanthobacter]